MMTRLILLLAAVLAPAAAMADQYIVRVHRTCQLIDVRIDGHGSVKWNGMPVTNRVALEAKLVEASQRKPKPCLNLVSSADGFGRSGSVIALMQKYGFSFAFVTRPGASDAPESIISTSRMQH